MANSIAYVLSKNTYPDAFQANLIGVDQGTQIVYTTTSTLTTANVLYADSRLTQPIYGDGTSWYGVQLLTNTSVLYAITISESGVIAINSGTTTTTAAPTTTTTTASVAPTEYNRPYYLNENNACNSTTDGSITFYSTASPNLNLGANNDGKTVFTNIELTVPVTQGYVLTFGNPMFPAKYTVLAGGVLQTTVCSTTTTTTAAPTTTTTTIAEYYYSSTNCANTYAATLKSSVPYSTGNVVFSSESGECHTIGVLTSGPFYDFLITSSATNCGTAPCV
jgi:hypothetical protein